jgi:hypothetical protein
VSQKQIRPRPEQIAELTQGRKLPLPPVSNRNLRVLTKTLATVWSILLRKWGMQILSQDESDITTLIVNHFKNPNNTYPQWSHLVSNIDRGTEMCNFDCSRRDMKPDILISLTDSAHSGLPLIVECKLIDAKTKSVGLYCNKGLVRFINGNYAWYDQQAIMLAYVRDASTIATSLTPHLSKHQNKQLDPFACEQLPEAVEATDMDLARSRHGRNFHYIHQQPKASGSIVVWHLWLS